MANSRATGLAMLRAYQNLRAVPPGPATTLFDATWKAGRMTDLALRIRRHGRLTIGALESFAMLVSIPRSDLHTWVLPVLRDLAIVDYTTTNGSIRQVDEQVGVAAGVLEQAAALWERMAPEPVEACAIASADHATYSPMALSDHRNMLEVEGFPAHLHTPAFEAMRAVCLLRREYSIALGEDVLWAPYVWGTEAVDIATFMKKLPSNERQALARLSRRAIDHPGTPIDNLGPDVKLFGAARHAGLLDATRVLSGPTERIFTFPPGLENQIGGGLTDATHERKLFVAHILNGHLYGSPATGRIRQPLTLVRALIERGVVGPTTAANRDYGLLEAAGIVRAEPLGNGNQALLHLVKKDVAEDSLALLSLALADEDESTATSVDSLWIPGAQLRTPEADRHGLPAPTGAENEVIHSTIMQLRHEIGKQMRSEEP